jgi:hypothetical protein
VVVTGGVGVVGVVVAGSAAAPGVVVALAGGVDRDRHVGVHKRHGGPLGQLLAGELRERGRLRRPGGGCRRITLRIAPLSRDIAPETVGATGVDDSAGGYTPNVGTGDRPLGDLLRRAVSPEDPDDALRAITVLRGELDRLERDAVACARVSGSSWSTIADALSITRQAAQKRHRSASPSANAAPAPTVLVTAPARMAVRFGRQEARAMGCDLVGSEHLLLGILRSGGHRAAHVLNELGVSLDDARAAAQPTLVDGQGHTEPAGKDGISAYARSVLEQSLREAVARGEGYIGVEHLLLALLREDVGGAARTLAELGVDPEAVRERLACAPPGPRAA